MALTRSVRRHRFGRRSTTMVAAFIALASALGVTAAAQAGPTTVAATSTVPGIDVSGWQGTVDWSSVYGAGYRYAYINAADGTSQNAYFTQEYSGARSAGLLRGAYFFAEPVFESGTTHADWFLNQINYLADGSTLPPELDVEQNVNQPRCDGLAASVWIAYVQDFVTEVKRRTGVTAVIYTNPDTWTNCVGNTTRFHTVNPLWVANFGVSSPALFGGWTSYTFWQYGGGAVPGVSGTTDLDRFNGTLSALRTLAPGGPAGRPYQVTGTNSAGLAVQSRPHINHVVAYVPDGTTLSVLCQTNHGDQVDGRTSNGVPFTTWDQISGGNWVYDWYLNTPLVGADGYSAGIPACSGG
jgi:GH25 family lysozyme M1 (1,4-beta-N-acetylmuramidase)